jgi:hypothetical protein
MRVLEGTVTREVSMQVFEEMSKPGAMYQQFYKWGLQLQQKAIQKLEAGDPTAEQTLTQLNAVLEACPAGVEKHSVPLYVFLFILFHAPGYSCICLCTR